jgi:hypothetical protein
MLSCRRVTRENAIVCRHVADGAPILFAARDDGDGAACEWEFGCGADGDGPADVRLVPLEEVVRRDPTAVEIVLHPRGTTLERPGERAAWHTGEGPVLLPPRPSRRWPGLDPRYPPRRGEPLDGRDLRLMADVAHAGFHVVNGVWRGSAPGAAFSVGLFRSFDHPEVAVFGLAADALAAGVRRIAARVRAGERFDAGDVAEGILDGRAVTFRRIVPRHCPAHLGHAVWYHGGARFPALQVVWSEGGLFPWDRWFPRALRDAQPALFEPEPA